MYDSPLDRTAPVWYPSPEVNDVFPGMFKKQPFFDLHFFRKNSFFSGARGVDSMHGKGVRGGKKIWKKKFHVIQDTMTSAITRVVREVSLVYRSVTGIQVWK